VSVAAVVVTHDREALLRRCLAALDAQTRRCERIYVVDNASTDGTADLLAGWEREAEGRTVVRLERNTGGAGGFHEGMRRAYEDGHHWLWLMDDDTHPRPDCLERLLDRDEEHPEIKLRCSRVVWRDGLPHTMNGVGIRFQGREDQDLAYRLCAERGWLAVKEATFVSCAIHRDAVRACGLPIADYFIWVDDVEYTMRVCRTFVGVLVPGSEALHDTPGLHSAMQAPPWKFYYAVRNGLWTWRFNPGSSPWEHRVYLFGHAFMILTYLFRRLWDPRAAWHCLRGVCAGLFRRPRIVASLPEPAA